MKTHKGAIGGIVNPTFGPGKRFLGEEKKVDRSERCASCGGPHIGGSGFAKASIARALTNFAPDCTAE